MSIATIFDHYSRPKERTQLLTILLRIKNGRYKNKIEKLRFYYDHNYKVTSRVVLRKAVKSNIS